MFTKKTNSVGRWCVSKLYTQFEWIDLIGTRSKFIYIHTASKTLITNHSRWTLMKYSWFSGARVSQIDLMWWDVMTRIYLLHFTGNAHYNLWLCNVMCDNMLENVFISFLLEHVCCWHVLKMNRMMLQLQGQTSSCCITCISENKTRLMCMGQKC